MASASNIKKARRRYFDQKFRMMREFWDDHQQFLANLKKVQPTSPGISPRSTSFRLAPRYHYMQEICWTQFCMQWLTIGAVASPLGDEYLTPNQRTNGGK